MTYKRVSFSEALFNVAYEIVQDISRVRYVYDSLTTNVFADDLAPDDSRPPSITMMIGELNMILATICGFQLFRITLVGWISFISGIILRHLKVTSDYSDTTRLKLLPHLPGDNELIMILIINIRNTTIIEWGTHLTAR